MLKDENIIKKAKNFLKKKSQDIHDKINKLQFGKNCSTARKLVCEVHKAAGFYFLFFIINVRKKDIWSDFYIKIGSESYVFQVSFWFVTYNDQLGNLRLS